MKQSRFSFIIVCCILYTFRSDLFNPLATEITSLLKSCPTVNGLSNFTIDELDGTYSAVAMYSKSLGRNAYETCYKIKFTQISNDRTQMQVVWKSGILPVNLNIGLLSEQDNGTFRMVLGDSSVPMGQAYIIANSTNIIYHSCRPGLLGGSSQDVLVLSKNETILNWTDEDKAEAKAVLKQNNLDYGSMKPVNQNPAECAGLKFLTNV